MIKYLAGLFLLSSCYGLMEFRRFKVLHREEVYIPTDVFLEFTIGVLLALLSIYFSMSKIKTALKLDFNRNSFPMNSKPYPNFTHLKFLMFTRYFRPKLKELLSKLK